jgi:hypothetical protein
MLEGFDKIESGELVEYLVMLRDDEDSNKTIVLHGKDNELHELWSGVALVHERVDKRGVRL